MKILKKIADTRGYLVQPRKKNLSIGFVPTMGALHGGHFSLVRASKAKCDMTVVSIFVNPTQFAETEDIEKYPRTLEQDITRLEKEGIDILFLPSQEEMYPDGAATFINVEKITEGFEGAIRPTHFRGVATVVASFFNIVQPDVAFFGQKDIQQVAVIKQMVRDLHFPVKIEVCETVRDADGLAMSSRNRYLSSEERTEALILSKTLFHLRDSLLSGIEIKAAKQSALNTFNSLKKKAVLDYLDTISSETFQSAESFKGSEELAIIIAARIGATRLIDNVLIKR